MKVKIIESMETYTCTQSTVEREKNPVVVAVRREGEGEAIRQKGQFGIRTVWCH
jgi:hypothetical protein